MPKRPMPWLMYVETPGDGGGTPPEGDGGGGDQPKTFTQDEVNALLAKQKREHRAEVAGLQSKVDEGRTLEQRLAEVEQRAQKAEADALRARVAGDYGISTKRGPNGEPSDAELFLTGTDEDSLVAAAQRLAQRTSDRKKSGNVAPKEGGNSNPGGGKGDLRELTRGLFSRAAGD